MWRKDRIKNNSKNFNSNIYQKTSLNPSFGRTLRTQTYILIFDFQYVSALYQPFGRQIEAFFTSLHIAFRSNFCNHLK